MTKNILIVKGGEYAEAEVSRKTAINVEKALKEKGYNTMTIEPQNNLIDFLNNNKEDIDIIFNALHGSWGEDGKIQGLFEYFGIPYTHSGVSPSAVGMNKFLSKSIFLNNNIRTPKGRIFINKNLSIQKEFERPYIIKPINEGSSVGIKLIKKDTDINIFLKNQYLDHLMEEYIPGSDFTVGLMNGKVIGMLEIITEKEIYDYEFKYNSSSTKYVIPTNFRINLQSDSKKVFLLEINTQPGLTENSLFPKIAENSGLKFPDLVEWIINDAGVNR